MGWEDFFFHDDTIHMVQIEVNGLMSKNNMLYSSPDINLIEHI